MFEPSRRTLSRLLDFPAKYPHWPWVTVAAAVSNEAMVANITRVETQMDLGLQLAAAQVPGKQRWTSVGHDTKLN